MAPRPFPAHLALWGAVLLAGLAGQAGFLPWPTGLSLLLLAFYGSVALSRPPVPARVIGWTQMGFGLLVVLATALGYTLEGVPTALPGVGGLHRLLGYALTALAFLAGLYLLARKEAPRFSRALLGLYDLNALLGLLSLAFSQRLWPHPLLALGRVRNSFVCYLTPTPGM
ncbi:hypothetical protein [Thermus scotoductus]|uniref:hypothetical protein n=1 Tax=Thermus scotoductus TaxID=37636 RepID=UPI0020A5821C|nr:hypothetical protein [Thermus scotoductus]